MVMDLEGKLYEEQMKTTHSIIFNISLFKKRELE